VCTWYFLINCVKELNDLLYLDIIPFWEFRRETMCVYLNILHVNHLSWTMVLKHPTAPTTSPDFQNSPWAKSAVQTSEISTEPPFLLIKSIMGYNNINCKKAYTVLYTIHDMPINVEQHFIEYCIHIYRFHVLHEARHHELNEISDYKLILTYTAINVEQRNWA